MRDTLLRLCLSCITGRWSPITWASAWHSRAIEAWFRELFDDRPMTWADLSPFAPKPRTDPVEMWTGPVLVTSLRDCSATPSPSTPSAQGGCSQAPVAARPETSGALPSSSSLEQRGSKSPAAGGRSK